MITLNAFWRKPIPIITCGNGKQCSPGSSSRLNGPSLLSARSPGAGFLTAVVFGVIALLAPCPALGQQWVNSAGGNWFDFEPTNWSEYPVPGDSVSLRTHGTYTIHFSGAEMAGFSNVYYSNYLQVYGTSSSQIPDVTLDLNNFDPVSPSYEGYQVNGRLYVGYGSSYSGTLTLTNGTMTTLGYSYIGYNTYHYGVSGQLNVATGATWNATTAPTYVGNQGNGTLCVTDGGNASISNYLYVGYDSNGVGTVRVDGSGSTLTANSTSYIGQEGRGTLIITNGGSVVANDMDIGRSGGTGLVRVDGSGSALTLQGSSGLCVGNGGTGTLDVRDGAALNMSGTVNVCSGGRSSSQVVPSMQAQ